MATTLCRGARNWRPSQSATRLARPLGAARLQGRPSPFSALSQEPQRMRCFASSSRWGASLATATSAPVPDDPGAPSQPADQPPAADKMSKNKNILDPEAVPFDSLKGAVSYPTLKAITVKPFKLTHMTPVQAAVLPLLPDLAAPYSKKSPEEDKAAPTRDLLVRAKTGTGKTLAFLVPVIEARIMAIDAHGKQAVLDAGLVSDKHLEARAKRVFARTHVGTLIISPTRELATQIANEALRLAYHHEGFEVRLFVGGASKRMQMRDWMKGRRDIVVTTPGRMRDLLTSEPDIEAGLKHTQTLVLDEADTLLDMGFRDDIDAIIEYLPKAPERQTFLFSATVSPAIRQVARATLDKKHLFINTVSENTSPVHAHVPQYHTVLPSAADQLPHIIRLIAHDQLTNVSKSKIILFLPTTKMTQLFATLLRELCKVVLPAGKGTRIFEIHSKRTQEARTTTSDAFRQDRSGASVLVTSDVSARGVDYPGVTRVVQVGIPGSAEQYVHRIGRTGRAGTAGRGDLVLLPWEVGFVTWQLQDVPLKPVTTNELKKQLMERAEAFDADPAAAYSAGAPPARDKFGRAAGPARMAPPVAPALGDIEKEVRALLPALDEEAVKETFASLLGYYMAKSPELRVQKGVVVEGCKAWSVEACGLPHPPYVSDVFLARLGMHDGRTKRFGAALYDRGGRGGGGNRPSWEGRGQQRLKGRERSVPEWSSHETNVDPDDPSDYPEQFRSQRYGKPPREDDFSSPRQSEFGSGGRGWGSGERRGGGSDRRGGGGGGGGGGGFDRSRSFGGRRSDGGESGYGMRR